MTTNEVDRFAMFSDDEIAKWSNTTDAVNTKRAMKAAITCLQHYLFSTDQEINLDSFSVGNLSSLLLRFYIGSCESEGCCFVHLI